MCENVGALDCLGREAEDVVDDENGGGGIRGTGGVALHAIEVDVFALFFVTFGNGWRDVTACFAVSLLCFHIAFVSVWYRKCSYSGCGLRFQ